MGIRLVGKATSKIKAIPKELEPIACDLLSPFILKRG
jgi:hypothetical protein